MRQNKQFFKLQLSLKKLHLQKLKVPNASSLGSLMKTMSTLSLRCPSRRILLSKFLATSATTDLKAVGALEVEVVRFLTLTTTTIVIAKI